MTFTIDYAMVSPSVLSFLIQRRVQNAVTMWQERPVVGDTFTMTVGWYDESLASSADAVLVWEIVAPYL